LSKLREEGAGIGELTIEKVCYLRMPLVITFSVYKVV
jgi:hypothetical protein